MQSGVNLTWNGDVGLSFVSELAGAVKRKQEGLRSLPITTAAAAVHKPAIAFGPSAEELMQMRSGLRKCSNPATFSPAPSPVAEVHPALARQTNSPEWAYSPTVAALPHAAGPPPPAVDHIAIYNEAALADTVVLPTVTPQATEQQATAQAPIDQPEPPRQFEANSNAFSGAMPGAWEAACAPLPSPQADGACEKTVPIDDIMRQIMTQQLAIEGANEQPTPPHAATKGSQRSPFSPMPTPPPMFDAPAPADSSAAAAAKSVAEAAAQEAPADQHDTPVAGVSVPTPRRTPAEVAPQASTEVQHLAVSTGAATEDQDAGPAGTSRTPQYPAAQPAVRRATPAALPLSPVMDAPVPSAATSGHMRSRSTPPIVTPHAASAPASSRRVSSIHATPAGSAARATPRSRSSSAPARSPPSTTPEATRRELLALRLEAQQMRAALAALHDVYPETDDPELLERPIAFANKLREHISAKELAVRAPRRLVKLKLKSRNPGAGAGIGKGLLGAAPPASSPMISAAASVADNASVAPTPSLSAMLQGGTQPHEMFTPASVSFSKVRKLNQANLLCQPNTDAIRAVDALTASNPAHRRAESEQLVQGAWQPQGPDAVRPFSDPAKLVGHQV